MLQQGLQSQILIIMRDILTETTDLQEKSTVIDFLFELVRSEPRVSGADPG